ncbi:MAG: DUF192 domain-containing protein [Rickettsiales bacterium]
MKNSGLIIILAILLTGLYTSFSYITHAEQKLTSDEVSFNKEQIFIATKNGKKEYKVEIASTIKQLEIGLMYRKNLPKDNGMLFLFNKEQKIYMWMKNTYISLDMLFIDNSGKIVYIAENTTPNSLDIISSGNIPARAVLELNAGDVKKNGISIGDKVIYKVFE